MSQITSPLEHQSIYFRRGMHHNVIENPQKRTLIIHPAGYTKYSTMDGINRQKIHSDLYTLAKEFGAVYSEFPFGSQYYSILLKKEPDNKYDPFAIKIMMDSSDSSYLSDTHNLELGYIPSSISEQVSKNFSMFDKGQILTVNKNIHDKFYNTAVIFKYDLDLEHKYHTERSDPTLDRFKDLEI